ncbi:MAG: universal stress protein [Microbacteriaceae bacterium]
MQKIVIGVSDATREHPSVDWAMHHAKRHSAQVELVHVVDTSWGHAPEGFFEKTLLAAEENLRDQAQKARELCAGVTVESHVRIGSPTNELVAAAEGADLLVIGVHPKDRNSGASQRIARLTALATCSVVIAPSAMIPSGQGVVVGVDGSVESDLAVRFAAELADAFGDELTVVLAWGQPEPWAITEPVLLEDKPTESDGLIIAESIAGLADSYPDLVIRAEVSGSRPERVLSALATGARMLVVGSRGRGGLERALLGSVSESLVAELPCAVAVIRARRDG